MNAHTEPISTRLETLKSKPWQVPGFAVPAQVAAVTGMLNNQEKRMLYWLAKEDYRGEGAICDLGAFVGGSTICFAAGLREAGVDGRVIHSYDLFRLPESESKRFSAEELPADRRSRPIFDRNLRDHLDLVEVHEGDVTEEQWESDAPIEILFVDIAKSYKVMDHLLLTFFPALIPQRSLLIMQDYLWSDVGPWHHVVIEKLRPYLEYVVDTDYASMVFFVKEAIPREALEECQWMRIPADEKLRLMDQAIERMDTDEKRKFLLDNREMLLDGRDMQWGMHYHEQ